jgi:ABC-type transport system involved in multi-copper enzyme maturation permease subunit
MHTFVIARLTFLEAMRRRILLAALLLGIAFLILYGIGFYFIDRDLILGRTELPEPALTLMKNQIYNFLLMAGLYAINFLTLAMGALVSADTLAGEIGSGTIQTVVTKPMRRVEVVLGKWLGFAILIALYLLFMIGGVLGIVYAISGYVPPNVARGVSIIFLETLLVMSITLACSSTVSTLATGGIVFGLYGLAFIGGFVEQIGAVLKNDPAVNIGIVSSLIMPSEALLRRASYEMTTPVAQSFGLGGGPLVVVSVPSLAMVAYGAIYLLVMVWLAVRQFNRRDL